jgi:hypothetical protein
MRLKLTVLLLCAAPLLRSQAIQVPPDGAPPSATIHQTVNNVLVDVVVTDKSGSPLKGLAKEHFQLLENGVPSRSCFLKSTRRKPRLRRLRGRCRCRQTFIRMYLRLRPTRARLLCCSWTR